MNIAALTGPFAHVPTDWILLAILFVIILIDTLRSGASRAIALSLALPVLYVFATLVPKTAFLDSILKQVTGVPYAIVLLAILGFLSLCMYRMTRDYNKAIPLKAIMAALAAAILLAVFWIQIPALSGIWHFSTQATRVFGSAYALYWILGSYTALIAVRR